MARIKPLEKDPTSSKELNNPNRHKGFQFGTNPLEMSAFEKKLSNEEVAERKRNTEMYINGIQGRDGGCFPKEQTKGFEDIN